jgi:hypothetical protein
MRFAHLKTHHGFERLRLKGLSGSRDEFHLAAIVLNLKTLALRLLKPPEPAPAELRASKFCGVSVTAGSNRLAERLVPPTTFRPIPQWKRNRRRATTFSTASVANGGWRTTVQAASRRAAVKRRESQLRNRPAIASAHYLLNSPNRRRASEEQRLTARWNLRCPRIRTSMEAWASRPPLVAEAAGGPHRNATRQGRQ